MIGPSGELPLFDARRRVLDAPITQRWCARVVVLAAALAVPAAATSAAHAAQISIDAPASCLDPATLTDEVSGLVGKPLASVADVAFRVAITQRPRHGWRLRLETLDSAPAGAATAKVLGSREIDAASCAELAEAVSVAIAVAVRAIDEKAAPAQAPAPAASVTASPASAAPAPAAGGPAPPPSPSWQPALALAFATDSGALPNAGFGVDLEGHLRRGPWGLIALATWFGSREIVGAANTGGKFQLVVGGLLACWSRRWGRWAPLACGGLELGRLSGTGVGVPRPETGDAFWRAARGDLGFSLALRGNAAVILRAGLVRPLARPEFVLDQSQLVYRPDALAVRLTAGLQLGF